MTSRHLTRLATLPRRFARLAPVSRRFAARAWLAAPFVELYLARRGLARTLALLARLPRVSLSRAPRRPRPVGVAEGRRLVDAAYAAHVVRGACLPRALVQYLLHHLDGVEAELRIGVRRERGDLTAHAWVDPPGAPASEPFETLLTRR